MIFIHKITIIYHFFFFYRNDFIIINRMIKHSDIIVDIIFILKLL